jgi:hypothetical protein
VYYRTQGIECYWTVLDDYISPILVDKFVHFTT